MREQSVGVAGPPSRLGAERGHRRAGMEGACAFPLVGLMVTALLPTFLSPAKGLLPPTDLESSDHADRMKPAARVRAQRHHVFGNSRADGAPVAGLLQVAQLLHAQRVGNTLAAIFGQRKCVEQV